MNLTKVRSATAAHFRSFRALAGAGLIVLPAMFLATPASAAEPAPSAPNAGLSRVVIAMLPSGTELEELNGIQGLSPGLMSAGLGRVLSEQTYLDISQGNRVFAGFYEQQLPFLLPLSGEVDGWQVAVQRANAAPAEIVPGLLAGTLERVGAGPGPLHGLGIHVDPRILSPALIGTNESGRYAIAGASCGFERRCPPGVMIVDAFTGELPSIISRLRDRDMLVVIERAPPGTHHGLAMGIAGKGFDGNLVSDSTRLRGVVLSTDVAPTVLARYGIKVPGEMTGRPIRTEGAVDPERLVELDNRLSVVAPRRGPVIGITLEIFALITALGMVLFGRRGARIGLALLAISCIYLPAVLLLAAAFDPSLVVERLIVGVGGPLLAGLTVLACRGYWALAVACAVTVGVYAVDMIAGSRLTPFSLMGPNPALGVRFYGIGNELEATLTAMTLVGTGAALTAIEERRTGTVPEERRLRRRQSGPAPAPRSRQAAWFVAVTVVVTAVFALGRFGADVGAAIVLPVGGATAALYVLGVRGKRFLGLVLLAPIAGVAALVALDLASGGNSHLSRSVLHASDTQSLGDVISRRLRSSGSTFQHPENGSLLLLAFGLIGGALLIRHRMAAWFEGRLPALAGFLGAVVATLVGALANDSGALVLMLGTGVLFLNACFSFSQALGAEPAGVEDPPETSMLAQGKIH